MWLQDPDFIATVTGFVVHVIAICVTLLVLASGVRTVRRLLRDGDDSEGPPVTPYGMGPTGIARRTVPSLFGLEVRELAGDRLNAHTPCR